MEGIAHLIMQTIYLIRHGRTEWNRDGRIQGRQNSPLISESRHITEAIADYMYDKNIDSVISSPLRRCTETADIICRILDKNYSIDVEMMECDHGMCEGMTLAQIEIEMPDFFRVREMDKWNTKWPGGESYSDVFKRAHNIRKKIMDEKSYLIIAHEMFNKCLIGALVGWTQERIIVFKQRNEIICLVQDNQLVMVEVKI